MRKLINTIKHASRVFRGKNPWDVPLDDYYDVFHRAGGLETGQKALFKQWLTRNYEEAVYAYSKNKDKFMNGYLS